MNPIRFVHTSDIHLDTSFAASGLPSRLGDRKREAIRGTLRRILEEARELGAAFVLIAGDLFEQERVTPDTVQFLRRLFAAMGGMPVFIAPGNHDPCVRGSPYLEESWPENVHIFREEEFRSVILSELGVRVAGFGYTRTHIPENPFDSLPPLPDDAVNIVLCHASDLGRLPQGKACHGPFRIESVAGKNVRYCALGHYHQQRPVEGAADGTAAWYCGIPEGRGWDEEGRGGYLLVEAGAEGVRVENRTCARYPLATVTLDCEGFTTREQILDALLLRRGTAFDPDTVLRVRLVGFVDPRLEMSLAEIGDRLAGEALHVAWEDLTRPALDFESLGMENTLRGQFARVLNDRIASAPPEEREVLERARLLGLEALFGHEVRLR